MEIENKTRRSIQIKCGEDQENPELSIIIPPQQKKDETIENFKKISIDHYVGKRGRKPKKTKVE